MKIKSVLFKGSKASIGQIINKESLPEIPVCGKSNVGKSSFLNTIFMRKRLVKTSSTPGKTQLINYFLVNDEFYFVDLPGYGYAKVPLSVRENWQELIYTYLSKTRLIFGIFWLVDIRHLPTKNDIMMLQILENLNIPFSIIATKADKLSKNQRRKQIKEIAKLFEIDERVIVPFSSHTKEGRETILEITNKFLGKK